MSGHEYDVSDVLWIIRSDRPGMLALQVVEVITKKTIQGEQTQYLVVSSTNPNRTVLLHTIEGRLFRDIDQARNALYAQATKAIDNIVDKVKQSADEAFQAKQPDALDFMKPSVSSDDQAKIQIKSELSDPQFKQRDIPEDEKDQYQEVEMDGRTVKIKLPDM
jgi:hypothetical protein